jgi:hypothetical protein
MNAHVQVPAQVPAQVPVQIPVQVPAAADAPPAPLVPAQHPLPAPAQTPGDHYVVIAEHRSGNYAPERDEADLVSRDKTVRDIYEGQIEDVARVFVFNPVCGTSRDVTVEIARDVAGLHFTEQTEPAWERRDWLHEVLGCHQADLILGVAR